MSKIMARCRNLLRGSEDGASLVEYGLLVGLIALAAVAGVTLMGTSVNNMFASVGNYLTGLPLP